MKKTVHLLLALFAFTYVSAQTVGDMFTVGDYSYTVTSVFPDPDEAELSGSALTELVVPSSVDYLGFPFSITGVGEFAFHDRRSTTPVTSVVFPASVVTIKTRAFRRSGLETVNLENVVTFADKDTFSDCNLTEVDLSSAIYIGRFAFNNAPSIPIMEIPVAQTIADGAFRKGGFADIIIPSSVTTIGASIFDDCESLLNIQLEWDVANIITVTTPFLNVLDPTLIKVYVPVGTSGSYVGTGWDAATIVEGTIPEPPADPIGTLFTIDDIEYRITSVDDLEVEVASSTLVAITVPAMVTKLDGDANTYSVTAIGSSAFLDDTTLTSVALPTSVTVLKSDSFSGCTNLETINLENIVTIETQNVFFNTPKITSIDLASATSVGNFAFHGLSDSTLSSISIPNMVTIGRAAFRTTQIPSIDIPATVTSIGTLSFMDCTALTEIQVNWTDALDIPVLPTDVEGDAFTNLTKASITLYVPAGTSALYSAAAGWQDFNIVEGTLSASSVEKALGFSMYPNPTNGVVSIRNKQLNNASITVYDLNGRALLSKKLNSTASEINISNLSNGLYIFRVQTENGEFAKRIIKQ